MKNLARIRTQRGLTQRDVAELIGVTPATVSGWETGWQRPTANHLEDLARAFHTTVAHLLGHTGGKPGPKPKSATAVADESNKVTPLFKAS